MESNAVQLMDISTIEMMNNEMNNLRNIVERVFRVNILDTRRKREIVEARMVFSKILHDRGYGVTFLGRFLKKTHCSVIHYVNMSNSLYNMYPEYVQKYNACNDSFINNCEPLMYMTDKEMARTIEMLRKKLSDMIEERQNIVCVKQRYGRLLPIIEMLDMRVPLGKEEDVKKSIRKVLNNK